MINCVVCNKYNIEDGGENICEECQEKALRGEQ